MKTEKNIFIAFILNMLFSIFELFGGLFTHSIAIISDAIHDFGDAISIGVSYLLEKKSKKGVDNKYTFGYVRYSILGAAFTNTILVAGSILVIYNAIIRILNPVKINYDGMIIFGILGVIVNFIAAYNTRKGNSLNQKSVNLHMLEDILGWIVVLIGAIIMRFTNIGIIDPIMSLLVALYIIMHAGKNFETIVNVFLEKTPENISIEEIKTKILKIKDIKDVHHIHIWSLDGFNNYATMHIVTNKNTKGIKDEIRKMLTQYEISHVTLEFETELEECIETTCNTKKVKEKTEQIRR